MKKFLVVFVDNSGHPEIDVSIVEGKTEEEVITKVWENNHLDPNEVDEYDYYIDRIVELDPSSHLKFI